MLAVIGNKRPAPKVTGVQRIGVQPVGHVGEVTFEAVKRSLMAYLPSGRRSRSQAPTTQGCEWGFENHGNSDCHPHATVA